MRRIGTTSSQIRKFSGYMAGGLPATSGMSNLGGDSTVKALSSYGATNIIQKILFVSDTTSTLAATLSGNKRAVAGYSNKSVAGYTLGGEDQNGVSNNEIEKLSFNTESNSKLSTTLSTTIFAFVGEANPTVAGYTFGGYGGAGVINTINKMPFSTETNAATSATIGTARFSSNALSNAPTVIYNVGGLNSSFASTKQIRKLTLSNDTVSTMGILLTRDFMQNRAGISNVGTAGYINGDGGSVTVLNNNGSKLTYSSETVSAVTLTTAALATISAAQFANANIAGYNIGGTIYNASTDNATSKVMKMPFSTESMTVIGSMPTWIRQLQGFAYSL